MKRTQKQRTEKALEIGNLVEEKGIGFFTRNNDRSMTIFIRGAHGNDPNQWLNARAVEELLGPMARGGVEIDKISSHLFIRIPEAYSE